jgi:hypothetical protein
LKFFSHGDTSRPLAQEEILASATFAAFDPDIYVDRSVLADHSKWLNVRRIVNEKLEAIGPPRFNAETLELWVYPAQLGGAIRGPVIYNHLKTFSKLPGCLALRDLEEIQKKGIEFYQRFWLGKTLFAWRSLVIDVNGELRVPCISSGPKGDEVVLFFEWAERKFGENALSPLYVE